MMDKDFAGAPTRAKKRVEKVGGLWFFGRRRSYRAPQRSKDRKPAQLSAARPQGRNKKFERGSNYETRKNLSCLLTALLLCLTLTACGQQDPPKASKADLLRSDTTKEFTGDNDVKTVFPDTMEAWYENDGIFILGGDCAVSLHDVEADYSAFSGSDGDFMNQMQASYLMNDFNALFGDGTDITFSSVEAENTFIWSLAEFKVVICNDTYYSDAIGILYTDDTQRTAYKCFYTPIDDGDAMDYLMASVQSYGPEGDEGGAPDPYDPIYSEDDGTGITSGMWYVGGDRSGNYFIFDESGEWRYYVATEEFPFVELAEEGTFVEDEGGYTLYSVTAEGNTYSAVLTGTDELALVINSSLITLERLY